MSRPAPSHKTDFVINLSVIAGHFVPENDPKRLRAFDIEGYLDVIKVVFYRQEHLSPIGLKPQQLVSIIPAAGDPMFPQHLQLQTRWDKDFSPISSRQHQIEFLVRQQRIAYFVSLSMSSLRLVNGRPLLFLYCSQVSSSGL